VLGSMLPDFETMVRVRLTEVRNPDIQRGIDLHHRTDHAFHRTPTFLALCSHALAELTQAGVRRGTARAVAHIGSEMFLDGWLANEQGRVDDYLSALRMDASDHLQWQDEGRAFVKLNERLLGWGAPHDYGEPPFVLERLCDTLQRRPALSLLDDQLDPVAKYLPFLQRMVERAATELLDELQDALVSGN